VIIEPKRLYRRTREAKIVSDIADQLKLGLTKAGLIERKLVVILQDDGPTKMVNAPIRDNLRSVELSLPKPTRAQMGIGETEVVRRREQQLFAIAGHRKQLNLV
jgi:hypothetical protein